MPSGVYDNNFHFLFEFGSWDQRFLVNQSFVQKKHFFKYKCAITNCGVINMTLMWVDIIMGDYNSSEMVGFEKMKPWCRRYNNNYSAAIKYFQSSEVSFHSNELLFR